MMARFFEIRAKTRSFNMSVLFRFVPVFIYVAALSGMFFTMLVAWPDMPPGRFRFSYSIGQTGGPYVKTINW
ncbi:hypothetical protein [Phyllobacterium sp. OV277]|uniref:hypothetical protein n=1 Tax=Phyllobacterium sp. OV277 TaxID=1882772 RepID=UPI0011136697|nr:hypothetical protein [Phyllobacterium sp. OV277]